MAKLLYSVIPKAMGTFLEGYKDTYEFQMPSESDYAGYKFSISAQSVEKCSAFYRLRYQADKEFTLIKYAGREEGKKYSRPKINGEKMWDLLKSCDKCYLAYFNDYIYARGMEISRCGHYSIGYLDGKWFINDDGDVKRISAKNFELICELDPKQAQDLRERLKKDEGINKEIVAVRSIQYQIDHIFKYHLHEIMKSEGFTCNKTKNTTEAVDTFLTSIDVSASNIKVAIKTFEKTLQDKSDKLNKESANNFAIFEELREKHKKGKETKGR